MIEENQRAPLLRLLKPTSIAVVGGTVAAEVVRQCRKIGFAGAVWPVHPRRSEIEGLPAYPSIDALPGVPDAAFVAVPREETIQIVRALAQRGAGGAVCYASGFAELGGEGILLQERLVDAAGEMALLGPNCYGVINYLDGCALWPDPLGGQRVERGVAILTQSGNVALNLTLQRHHLPIAYMVAVGNKAVTDIHDCIEAFLADPRVTAIGLYLEGLSDVSAFSKVAKRALAAGIPIVVVKAGSSRIGALLAASHTRSLAGADVLYNALFKRLGIARAGDLAEFLETLKLLHTLGPLPGKRVGSLSCSGGDALLMADLGQAFELEFPKLSVEVAASLSATLGPLVPINNPLDYQAYIWGDEVAMTACFAAMMAADLDVCVLVLDIPHEDGASAPGWDEVVNAFIAAKGPRPVRAVLVASLPELLPSHVAERLVSAGIAPMQGLREVAAAIAAAAAFGAKFRALARVGALPAPTALLPGPAILIDEGAAKTALASFGLAIPAHGLASSPQECVAVANTIGYPVVAKAMAEGMAHKTEAQGVKLNLANSFAVHEAAAELALRFSRFLVEKMVTDGLAELIVGVTRDEQFGLALTLGAGGVWVELLADSATLLLPAGREEIVEALRSLKVFALLDGYRGRPRAELGPIVDAIEAIAAFALANADRLLELDVNPLIVGQHGVSAVDALLRMIDVRGAGSSDAQLVLGPRPMAV